MTEFRKIVKKGFNERFETDSHGRRFNLVQQGRLDSWAAKRGRIKVFRILIFNQLLMLV